MSEIELDKDTAIKLIRSHLKSIAGGLSDESIEATIKKDKISPLVKTFLKDIQNVAITDEGIIRELKKAEIDNNKLVEISISVNLLDYSKDEIHRSHSLQLGSILTPCTVNNFEDIHFASILAVSGGFGSRIVPLKPPEEEQEKAVTSP